MEPSQGRVLGQQVEEWMLSKGASACPLCRQEAWSFDETRRVIVIDADGARKLGRHLLNPLRHGEPLRGMRDHLLGLGNQLLQVRTAARTSPLLELKCENCGYVVLLDSKTVVGGPSPSEDAL